MPTIQNPLIVFTIGVTEHDWTGDTASATFEASRSIVSRPHFGDEGQNRSLKGFWDGSLVVDLDADYDTAGVTQTLYAALAADAPIDVAIRAKDAPISASNPEWRFQVAVESLPVIDGEAGALATHSITMPMHGKPTLVTSAS
jgi:hypothetical protein